MELFGKREVTCVATTAISVVAIAVLSSSAVLAVAVAAHFCWFGWLFGKKFEVSCVWMIGLV